MESIVHAELKEKRVTTGGVYMSKQLERRDRLIIGK